MVTTPEEFTAQMQEIAESVGWDSERAHPRMDALMAKVLTELGYEDGIALFEEQHRCYA